MKKILLLLPSSNLVHPMSFYKKNIQQLVGFAPILIALFTLILPITITAQPNIPESPFIKVDQFGYLPNAQKVAVISDPQQGYNQDASFQASTTYEVRVWETDEVVFSESIQAWRNGAVHSQSGDRGWWFDFSSVTSAGNYYLYDTGNQVRSIQFSIDAAVYSHVLKAATRMFFYNRSNIAKTAPYAQEGWRDALSFEQDSRTHYVLDKQNTALAKDLRGGWFDAGDLNKYVTYTEQPLHDLLWAFQENPQVFTDNWNIPESGNGIPDLIDEIKWELDWLVKMNNSDGSTHIKMGSQNFSDNNTAPPSTNTATRYYGPTCTSASITVAGIFAHAAKVVGTIPSLNGFAKELENRAIASWDYVLPFLNNNQLDTNCDNGEIIGGDADISVTIQKDRALTAAVYLLDLTGNTAYQQYILNAIGATEQITSFYWAPYKMALNDALLHYTTLSQSDAATSNLIITSFSSSAASNPSNYFDLDDSDLYRAFMPSGEYGWGSNKPKAGIGVLNQLLVRYKINESNAANYRQRANEQLHYFHGVNPLGIVYLTNMYSLGAERSANEIFHRWFRDDSIWDHALTSQYGPPPGYVVGGPNAYSSVSKEPPANQPPLKSYLDFNDDNTTNPSWEISEPSITYQGIYVRLVAHFATATVSCPPEGAACDDGNPTTTNDVADGFCACAGTRVESNCNLISNGSFATDITTWKFWECTPVFNKGEIHLTNIIAGSNPWDAAIRQENLTLEQGRDYTITFDARGTQNRTIVVKSGLSVAPFTAYLWQSTNLTTQMESYSFPFTMTESTTNFGALEFFIGGNATEIFIDNISLKPNDCQAVCLPAGTPCNDNNSNTANDVEDGNCNCAGTATCPPAGTPCNDNNPNTTNDVEDGNCNCIGTATCPPAGAPCNDNNSNTINDVEDGNCNCAGTTQASDKVVLFEFGQINGSADQTATLPVTVSNFTNISSFQFTIQLQQASNSTLVGINTVHLNDLDASNYALIDSQTMTVLWVATDGMSRTLPDKTVLFEVLLNLESTVGECGLMELINAPMQALVTQEVGTSHQVIPHEYRTGELCATNEVDLKGVATTENGQPIEDVAVWINNTWVDTTNRVGNYQFNNIPYGWHYFLQASKEDHPKNGLSTYDLVKIIWHIIGKEKLDSPYKMIAADVDNSGDISNEDVSLLQQLMLGSIDELPNSLTWRFVPAAAQFENNNPFAAPIPEIIDLPALTSNVNNQNFIGIKLGDVTQDAFTTRNATATNLYLKVDATTPEIGEEWVVAVKATTPQAVATVQMNLQFDEQSLELIEWLPGDLVDSDKLSHHIQNNKIAIIGYDKAGDLLHLDGKTLFYAKFKVLENIIGKQVLTLSPSDKNTAFTESGQAIEVTLVEEYLTASKSPLQVYPNPFSTNTYFNFHLEQQGIVTLSIYTAMGKTVWQGSKYMKRGTQEWLFSSDYLAAGVYFYKLETPHYQKEGQLAVVR